MDSPFEFYVEMSVMTSRALGNKTLQLETTASLSIDPADLLHDIFKGAIQL